MTLCDYTCTCMSMTIPFEVLCANHITAQGDIQYTAMSSDIADTTLHAYHTVSDPYVRCVRNLQKSHMVVCCMGVQSHDNADIA